MKPRLLFRSTLAARISVVAALMLGLAHSDRPAVASLAPAAPTFLLKWGTAGTGPGQFNNSIRGMAFDSDGNVYTCDIGNHRIQKFDPFGNFIRQWGSLGSGAGQFNNPFAIAVDASNNVYVVDPGNHRVKKFSSNGTFILSWQVLVPSSAIAVRADGIVFVADYQSVRSYSSTGTLLGIYLGGAYYSALAFDGAGNLYAGRDANVWKIGPNGNQLWMIGSAGSGNLQFNNITGLTTDAVGNVYVAEYGNSRIQKISKDGTYLSQWGGPGTGDGQFTNLFGVGVDPSGNCYAGDASRIQKFSGAGNPLSFLPAFYWLKWGTAGTAGGQFNGPSGIAVHQPTGALFTNFYVADRFNNRVHRFHTYEGALIFDETWGSAGSGNGQFQDPYGIATDPSGSVYVTDVQNSRVQKFSGVGAYQGQWGSLGTGPGQFNTPTGIAADDSGYIYVMDVGNGRVQKFTGAGAFVTSWGSFGSGPGQFFFAIGLAVDRAGLVYVADQGNARVQKFTRTGAYLGEWGSLPGPGQLTGPFGITVDRYGNVLVVDNAANRVVMFTSNGTFLTEWGTTGSGDGQFSLPVGVSTDSAGNVFVTDSGNNRIQEFAFPPRILSVSDVKNDQGGKVRVRFARSTLDAPGILGGPFQFYRVGMRNDSVSPWQNAGDTYATADAEYNAIVNVPVTAMGSNWFFTDFRVQAFPPGFFAIPIDGGPESGFAVDNLTPPPPTAFEAVLADGSIHLSWSASAAADFSAFRLYRGASADFAPSADNLVTETAGTSYVDAAPSGSRFKLSVVDQNGNESEYALASPGVAGVTPEARFALRGALQNPTRADRLEVSFSLARRGSAQLELYDVTGRCVLRREVGAQAGWQTLRLGAEARVSAGIYHVRLTQDGQAKTARVVVFN